MLRNSAQTNIISHLRLFFMSTLSQMGSQHSLAGKRTIDYSATDQRRFRIDLRSLIAIGHAG
jgi:hypothetical protein